MKNGLSLDLSKVQPYASLAELDKMEGMVKWAHETVHEKTGAGRSKRVTSGVIPKRNLQELKLQLTKLKKIQMY